MVTSINMEGLWMYTVNHLMRNGPKKKKKGRKTSKETTTVSPCKHNEKTGNRNR